MTIGMYKWRLKPRYREKFIGDNIYLDCRDFGNDKYSFFMTKERYGKEFSERFMKKFVSDYWKFEKVESNEEN